MPKKKESKQSKEQEYLDGWKRERAAFENFKKEQERRLYEFRTHATQDMLSSLLEIMDNFYLAIKHAPDSVQKDAWFVGMGHIEKQFKDILKRWGVEEIRAEGAFDPALHEVIEEVENSGEGKRQGMASGTIIEVASRGYRMGDTVLRPAKVRVNK